MPALLVDVGTAVGMVAGLVLDPVGQLLADRSRTAEERRRVERATRRPGDARGPTSVDVTGPVPGPQPVPELETVAATPVVDPEQEAAPEGTASVRHLLPEGRSLPRTVGAGAATGFLFGLAVDRLTVHGHAADLLLVLPFWVFLAMAVTVSVTDLTHRMVPRQLLYGALALIGPLLVVVSAHLAVWRPLLDAAGAGVVAFAVFFAIWYFVPRGMGFGDVRLAGVIGLTVGYLGLLEAYLAFLVGFVLGLVFGLFLMAASGSGRRTRIPFAPALCAGAAVAIVWGGPLVRHVFHVSG